MTTDPSSPFQLSDPLTGEEKKILLGLARTAIEMAVKQHVVVSLDVSVYSERLQQLGASFVTLTEEGDLRGCIGALEAYQPLVQDVCEHAVSAAMDDYRFSPVQPEEIPLLTIEISRLTAPVRLEYKAPDELIHLLRPNVDGVILRDGFQRATFLPQVWEKLPDTAEFLSHLCQKMGAPANLWRRKNITVFTYQVEEFHE
jgi:uncharacterized protein